MRTAGSRIVSVFVCVLLCLSNSFGYEIDDTVPEVTDRVARVSFLRGDVKIKRDGSQDWEKADLNLPVVEGDEIATEAGSRIEVQFNKDMHLRVAENSVVQMKRLVDGAVAVSIARGVASVRVRKFNGEKEFFEIDAPSTTVAIAREGTYRVDAATESEVRVSVTGGGEARVYSTGSGFTVKSGRSAKIFVEGNLAGEWETAEAGRFADEFDEWSNERDDVIAKALSNSHYDKYYDQDIYGAEELNDNGDWEFTSDYGYVWRPFARSISTYRDWSPYRYGSWRWVPPFGWTWVNDEPWGWATYHHGRWIWYRGRWVWTPYGYYRSQRSWWRPALVVVQVINTNVCWYPLGYRNRYRNYNGYHDWVGNRRRPRNDDPRPGTGTPPANVPPSPRPGRDRLPIEIEGGGTTADKSSSPPRPGVDVIPPSGVVSISADAFGVSRKIGSTAPPEIAKNVLSKGDGGSTPSNLPDYRSIRSRMGREISSAPPQTVTRVNAGVRIGASERRGDEPLDNELRRTKMWGNRQPLPPQSLTPEMQGEPRTAPRRTGAVSRPPAPRREMEATPAETVKQPPQTETPPNENNRRIANPRFERPSPREESPVNNGGGRRETAPPVQETPKMRRDDSPREESRRPPSRPPQETPRSDPPPRSEPPPRRDPPAPRQEQPRNDPPPRREQPPQPKNDSPPPKPDSKPSRKSDPIDR